MPLNQVATVNMVDARTANIKPFDGSLGKSIVTTLNDGKLNANIQLDGSLVKVAFPPITEENRKTNAKKAKEYLEQAKVQIRNIRTDVQKEIKKIVGLSEDLVKSYENNLDKLTKE
jgi:ribosome recycling factor